MADGAQHKSRRMTVREFLEWEDKQPRKHEFEDGLIRMMAGATRRHAAIQGNVFANLRAQLRGRPCAPYGSDMKVQTFPGAIYYPDVTVDCGDTADDATIAERPTVVFEILSKSTRDVDLNQKLPNYQATPSIQAIVYVETDRMHLMVWRRTEEGWVEDEVARPDDALELEAIGVSLTFRDIYEGVGFD